MPRKIATTGDLRDFLAEVMVDLREGRMEPNKAGRIAALAGQINASFLAEIAVERAAVLSGASAQEIGTALIAPAVAPEPEPEPEIITVTEPVAPVRAPEPMPAPQRSMNGSLGAALVEANNRIRAAKSAVPAPRF